MKKGGFINVYGTSACHTAVCLGVVQTGKSGDHVWRDEW